MSRTCPHCSGHLRGNGFFQRLGKSKRIQRYRCGTCAKGCSDATFEAEYRQKKREWNEPIRIQLCSKTSENRIARIFALDRKTVARKKRFLARVAHFRNQARLARVVGSSSASKVFLDELITFEHTRCKPLSVPALVLPSRHILAIEVLQMPAIGKHLARFARKRYGPRPNERESGITTLLERCSAVISKNAVFVSDEEPMYRRLIEVNYPKANHETYPSKRASVAGQGELKTHAYDPLFPINHTFAMFRDNVASLIRRTWCTCKKASSLRNHLEIYIDFHNSQLVASA